MSGPTNFCGSYHCSCAVYWPGSDRPELGAVYHDKGWCTVSFFLLRSFGQDDIHAIYTRKYESHPDIAEYHLQNSVRPHLCRTDPSCVASLKRREYFFILTSVGPVCGSEVSTHSRLCDNLNSHTVNKVLHYSGSRKQFSVFQGPQ